MSEAIKIIDDDMTEEIEELHHYTKQLAKNCPVRQLLMVQHLLVILEASYEMHVDRYHVRELRRKMLKKLEKVR